MKFYSLLFVLFIFAFVINVKYFQEVKKLKRFDEFRKYEVVYINVNGDTIQNLLYFEKSAYVNAMAHDITLSTDDKFPKAVKSVEGSMGYRELLSVKEFADKY